MEAPKPAPPNSDWLADLARSLEPDAQQRWHDGVLQGQHTLSLSITSRDTEAILDIFQLELDAGARGDRDTLNRVASKLRALLHKD